MVVIGITGGFGTGKSTVARFFKQLGAVVLDADTLAHQAMEPKKLAWRQIVKRFGTAILNDDSTIDRKQLAEAVFQDEGRRRQLEGIIHPQVLRALKRGVHGYRRMRKVPAVVLDVPLLIEAGAQNLVDLLVVVTAPLPVQMRRLKEKYGWTQEEIGSRISAQMDLSAKAALADYVVDNGSSVENTRKQVKRIWNQQVLRAPKRS